MNQQKGILYIFLTLTVMQYLTGQAVDSSPFRSFTRYSFYTTENKADILLHVPSNLKSAHLDIMLSLEGKTLKEWHGIADKEVISIEFRAPDSLKKGIILSEIATVRGTKYISSCEFLRLVHKPNEVRIDRLTGGLIVNNRLFYPFGFYCYSPVYPTLPEEEAVRGFNMISPYQKILPETLSERKAYMDRCASLGMKVHFNLLSVSGGGGVNSKIEDISKEQKRALLINEIRTFMDHPALLAWYISDEPTGNKVAPEEIEEIYNLVKSLDPWHPVSVVFMAPFISARKYSGGTDIVMADPYPVPERPVSMVGDVTGSLKSEFNEEKPVWIVPQAFGGGELWSREPTLQEVRSMTWQAIIKGATGIQYFIRSGLSSFPKSIATWNECGRIALEVCSLTPWLLSDEEAVIVNSWSKNILVASRMHEDQLVIMVVNTVNEPARILVNMARNFTGKANVLFENRNVAVTGGIITDIIPAFGNLVYKINLKAETENSLTWKENLVTDPGFEYVTSPGVPTSCYVSNGGDRGATNFLDSREHIEGNYSLRLQTPAEGKGTTIKLFPITVYTGSSYLVSLWAKCDPEQRFILRSDNGLKNHEAGQRSDQYVEVGLGNFGTARFIPTSSWKQYIGTISIPADSVPRRKTNVTLTMPGQGVGWFDMIQVIEDPLGKDKRQKLERSVNPDRSVRVKR